MLPSELLRRGRFDEIFFVDLPTMEERLEILSLYFSKYLHTDLAAVPTFAERLVQMSEGFTGADLESTVRELAYRMLAAGKSWVMMKLFLLLKMSYRCPKRARKKSKLSVTGAVNELYLLQDARLAKKHCPKQNATMYGAC